MTGSTPPCTIMHNCSAGWDHQLAFPVMLVAFLLAILVLGFGEIFGIEANWRRIAAAVLVLFAVFCGWHYFATTDW